MFATIEYPETVPTDGVHEITACTSEVGVATEGDAGGRGNVRIDPDVAEPPLPPAFVAVTVNV
jgi:hypothetical protein